MVSRAKKKEHISPYEVKHYKEVFTLLYVVTDSTCLNVEKAFALLNCRPQSSPYADIYSFNKGDINTHQVSVNFTCSVREGNKINMTAQKYLHKLIKTAANKSGVIDINSYEYDWAISGLGDPENRYRISELGLEYKNSTDEKANVKTTYYHFYAREVDPDYNKVNVDLSKIE